MEENEHRARLRFELLLSFLCGSCICTRQKLWASDQRPVSVRNLNSIRRMIAKLGQVLKWVGVTRFSEPNAWLRTSKPDLCHANTITYMSGYVWIEDGIPTILEISDKQAPFNANFLWISFVSENLAQYHRITRGLTSAPQTKCKALDMWRNI
jgi:uncharacterized membrane protein